MPHALRRVGGDDDLIADLAVIVGFDDDLASEVNRVSNRIWQQHPRRTPLTSREQTPQTGPIPLRFRSPPRPRLPRLLRPETRRWEETQRRDHLPSPTTRVDVLHAMLRNGTYYQPRPAVAA